ncbi:MAG: NGG1p interacting factor NIF3 [Spirochaetales bacterium]|nr:NGG1p interacting factor NIF3 [Spirochaetales bacterium]
MYQIVFFVPKTHSEVVKNALFEAGAGAFNNYEHCSWETEGTGQFRPLEGSAAFIGEKGKLERLPELRVEMLCTDEKIDGAIKALLAAHPYEEPAYYAVETRIITAPDS